MVDFTINLEIMTRVRAQRNETFRRRYEMQKRDATPVKSNGAKMNSSLKKVGSVTPIS